MRIQTVSTEERRLANQLLNIHTPFVILYILAVGLHSAATAQPHRITNDVFWFTKDRTPINSQGGGVFRFTDPSSGVNKYYWYGVHYKKADTYRNDPSVTLPNATFESVTCYSSTDLVNWSFDGDVLTQEELRNHDAKAATWVERLGVAYVRELNKYAMFVQHGSQVLIAVSDSPAGRFSWHQQISMKDMIGTTNTGDQTVFTDEGSGKSYLVYSYGKGRNKIYVSEIGVKEGMVSVLDCNKVFEGESREGNCMFKYRGRYYMCASNIYGWDASYAYYLVADDIRGPYEPTNDMLVMNGCADDYAHVTQTGFFVTIKGSKQETVIYCGDRWANFAGNGVGYNQWVPLSFEGKTPYFNSLNSWNLDAMTGTWNVANNNNYVRNGSFEADRKNIPSAVKPVQTELTGWKTIVLNGNSVSLDSTTSPILNHTNSEADRKVVTGEKSLNITDKVDFRRKVLQTISSTPFVELQNGTYTVSAKVKSSSGFSRLEMYATTGGRTFSYRIQAGIPEWTSIKLDNLPIRDGKVEIGFAADGAASSFCYVDDVVLVRSK
jgi:hypothetical protein